MNKYYEVFGVIDGDLEVLFGSFDRSDCVYELDAERHSWKAEGYKGLGISTVVTTDQPDPQVYGV